MALARTKVWIAEILTHGDLNAEFDSILNNPISLISPLTGGLDCDGQTLTLDAAAVTTVVSSAAVAWNFTSGAKTGTPATTGSIANWSAQTFTDNNTAGSGTAAAWVGFAIQRPTLAASNTLVTTTDAATFYVPNSPLAGTNQTLTNAWAIWVDAGNVRFDGIIDARGGQIAFPATQSASSDANTLDDYEEGTWTPALSFATAGDLSVAYASRNGYYTKVGRLVTAYFFLQTSTFTHTTASGNCRISGLPFANSNDTNNNAIGAMRWQGITKTNFTDVAATPESNATYLLLIASGSAQGGSFVAAADMPTTGTVVLAGTVTYNV